jgi:hypothetical protein
MSDATTAQDSATGKKPQSKLACKQPVDVVNKVQELNIDTKIQLITRKTSEIAFAKWCRCAGDPSVISCGKIRVQDLTIAHLLLAPAISAHYLSLSPAGKLLED